MKNKGFTLVEMLVATFIFSLLGLGLVSLMRESNKIWQDQESVKSSYSKALNVISQISNDLQSMVTDPNQNGRLIIARDPIGRFIVVFTKYLRSDVQDPIFRNSGLGLAYLDTDDNPWNQKSNENSGYAHYFYPKSPGVLLLPTTGKAEVAYIFSPYPRMKITLHSGDEYEGERIPDPNTETSGINFFDEDKISLKVTSGRNQGTILFERNQVLKQKYLGYPLYRGFVTPPGAPVDDDIAGSGSLFSDFVAQDRNVHIWMNDIRPILNQIQDSGVYDTGDLASWLYDFAPDLDLKYVSFADAVIYVGVQYWYDGDAARNGEGATWVPNDFPDMYEEIPPALFFDSSRGGFPSALRLTVTAMPTQGSLNVGSLSSDISSAEETIRISGGGVLPNPVDGFPFVLIGNEWIYFTEKSGKRLTNCYRGTRGTFATSHPAGTPVYWGTTLQKIIPILK
ncbi:MAG: prepilin-type N-terminal cleavage/methylation domain-containing protein [Planctomycetes bacterium]|nr:prepilin-type N-terminal cleavage/methylation domain-containing protein [Planctomycetota bacterium]